MTAKTRSPLWLTLPLLVCAWPGPADAARWQDHRAAAQVAVEDVDYAKAVEQLEAAVYFAEKQSAPDRDIASLWESLAAANLANEQYRAAWEAVSHWDSVLAANAGQAWAKQQQARRDQMTRFLFHEARATLRGTAAADERGAAPQGGSKAQPADGRSLTLAPAAAPLPAPAKRPENPRGYGLHLASFRNEVNARTGWATLQSEYPDLLGDKTYDLEPVDLGNRGTFVRLVARPFPDLAAAHAACRNLQRRAQYCAVMPPG